jgi:hypothetical protein
MHVAFPILVEVPACYETGQGADISADAEVFGRVNHHNLGDLLPDARSRPATLGKPIGLFFEKHTARNTNHCLNAELCLCKSEHNC